jgi:nitrous oxidase accessory protein NosD
MNDLPRQKLVEMIARHGPGLAYQHRRCEGLLRDYCSAYRREVAVLASALRERVAADLLAAGNKLPREVALTKLVRRLQDNLAMEESAARWAVNSWALALGFLSKSEIEVREQTAPQSVPMMAAAGDAGAKAQAPATPSPAVLVISGSGDGDYDNFREAMENLPANGRLLVRPGVYRESLVIDKPMEIIGDGKRQEIIVTSAGASCILMQTDRATVRGLTLRQGADDRPAGEGFFAVDIARGRLILEGCEITSFGLSCVGIHNKLSNSLIRHCRIQGGADSGIYLFQEATGAVEDSDIYENHNVGVAVTEGATVTLKRCSIRDGGNAGIVVWNGGGGVIEDCNIFSNAKANVGVSEGGNPTFRHCRIYDGANSGVFVHDDGQVTLEDCEIYNHAAPEVAVTLGGNLKMTGCRIHDGNSSGLFIGDAGRALIEECKITANADAGIQVDAGGSAAIRRCDINRNGSVAIRVKEEGAVEVEDCDLTDNEVASWQTEYGALIESQGNTP